MGNSREIPDFKILRAPHSQLVKDCQEFLLKAPIKTLSAISNQPFHTPHYLEAPTGNNPMGVIPSQAVPIILPR